ncbi:MAG: acetamidase/formamidase family protein, partial [Chloroflexi bacterium]|nr:acetamidase/formamidase family protein [Chloroflexota bacterium]
MQSIPRSEAMHYELNWRHEPKIRVKQGESFAVETEDAGSGLIRSPEVAPQIDDLPTRKFFPPQGNPMAGPVYVEGAERGDLLEVTIEAIEVGDQGFTAWGPGRGPFSDSSKWPELNERFVHIIKHLPGPSGTTRDGKGVFSKNITWDLAPMIGVVGTAPDREVESSSVGQGPWGGNL